MFIIFCLLITIVTNIYPMKSNNCYKNSSYTKCFHGLFYKISKINIKNNKPIFDYPINSNLLHKYPEHFEVYNLYKNNKNKTGIEYKYYKGDKLIGEYIFLINKKTKKYSRSKAIWYNYKGIKIQENLYYININFNENYIHEFKYYNNLGEMVRKTTQFFSKEGKFLYQKSNIPYQN